LQEQYAAKGDRDDDRERTRQAVRRADPAMDSREWPDRILGCGFDAIEGSLDGVLGRA
jgi:hypothetical protein